VLKGIQNDQWLFDEGNDAAQDIRAWMTPRTGLDRSLEQLGQFEIAPKHFDCRQLHCHRITSLGAESYRSVPPHDSSTQTKRGYAHSMIGVLRVACANS
jgi:hypothetical protein